MRILSKKNEITIADLPSTGGHIPGTATVSRYRLFLMLTSVFTPPWAQERTADGLTFTLASGAPAASRPERAGGPRTNDGATTWFEATKINVGD